MEGGRKGRTEGEMKGLRKEGKMKIEQSQDRKGGRKIHQKGTRSNLNFCDIYIAHIVNSSNIIQILKISTYNPFMDCSKITHVT